MPMKDDAALFANYRHRLLAASVPAAAAVVFAVTLLAAVSSALAGPQCLREAWTSHLVELLVPVAGWLAAWRWRKPLGPTFFACDAAYSATMVSCLYNPACPVPGVAAWVAVKMMATALLIPWGRRLQSLSVVMTLALLFVVGRNAGIDLAAGAESFEWSVPLFAGILSIAGAAWAERTRRAAFERERRMEATAEHLAQEVEVGEALVRVGRDLMVPPDKHRIIEALCRLTAEVLACDASHTFLWDTERQEYVPVGGYGDTPEQWAALRLVSFPESLMHPFQERIAVLDVEQFSSEDGYARPAALLRQFGVRTILFSALRRGGKLLGVLTAERRGERRPFSPQKVRIARSIGHLASLALETARMVEESEAASRVKAEFVATMSHELRSPLNVIIGYHELLLEGGAGPLDANQQELLERADRSARELLDVMTATLDLSRLQARRMVLDVGDVEVGELLDEIGSEVAESTGKADLEVRWHAAPDLPRIRTDRVKLKMVLKNLLGNAVKFTERGTIALEASRQDGGVEFSVTDTGAGVPPEAQEAIFEPFRQLDVTAEGAVDGVGLGLYIVKQLLAGLGGTIALESEVGRGSTFRVRIPVEPDGEADTNLPPAADAATGVPVN